MVCINKRYAISCYQLAAKFPLQLEKQSKFETSVMPAKWQVWRENGNCGQLSPSKTDWSHFVLSNCFRMRGTYWFSVTITTLHSFLTKNGKKKTTVKNAMKKISIKRKSFTLFFVRGFELNSICLVRAREF